jgi:hypothetical protein
VETMMNVLDLIRSKMLKTKRLYDAQFMMTKTYSGVTDLDAHHDESTQESSTKELTYRGQSYKH